MQGIVNGVKTYLLEDDKGYLAPSIAEMITTIDCLDKGALEAIVILQGMVKVQTDIFIPMIGRLR